MEDRYEILDVVATGAMATVWRAQDVRLGRTVAIKRPHKSPDLTSPDSPFHAAARSAAAVTHPNLITIFDTGIDETGPYLVLEFVDGPTLAEMGGSSEGVAALGSDVASGLSALHSAGIVHRDVRPSNIVLGPTGPKLTNFGTARTLDSATISSGVASPRFQAPEVLAAYEPTEAGDVYSLGAVLSWLASQGAPDHALSAAVELAMSEEPEARPTAATLSERLHRISVPQTNAMKTPPVALPPGEDATQHFDEALVPPETLESEPMPSPWRRWLTPLIAVLLVALLATVIALAGDDDPLPTAVDTTIVDPPATTTTPQTEETAAPGTTVVEDEGGVFSTVRIFVTFIRETPGNVLESSGAEEIISNVVDGVSEAIRGNDEGAESNLADAVEAVEEEIDSPSVIERAIELISRLARQLGLDVEGVVAPSE